MNWTPLQLALREVRAIYTDWRGLAVMALVGIVAGFAGPFGTFAQLEQAPRIAYWVFVTFTTFGTGTLFGAMVSHALPAAVPIAVRIGIASVIASVPVTAVVFLANALVLHDTVRLDTIVTLFGYCLTVTVAVLTLSFIWPRPEPAAASPQPPPILRRLAPHQRGALRRISTADHYVEIHTDKGMALVLLRFSDAIAETGDVAGLQVHRGHWVALSSVRTLKRIDGKPNVELDDGTLLPVSRGQLASVRAALEAR